MRKIFFALAVVVGICFVQATAFADDGDQFNLRFSPLGLIIGSINLNADIALGPDWTVGPVLQYWHINLGSTGTFTSNLDLTTYAVGARANWFKNGVFNSGLYVGPSLKYTNTTLTATDSTGSATGSVSGILAGCLVGYGWFWDSFNIMLGIGVDIGLGDVNVSISDSNGNSSTVSTSLSGLDGEFSLGWTF